MRPAIEVFAEQKGSYYEGGPRIPYELWVEIFKHVVKGSEDPLTDLCSIGGVSEHWRLIAMNCPQLWSRIDIKNLPTTDRNINLLSKIIHRKQPDLKYIDELSVRSTIDCKKKDNIDFIESLIKAPNLSTILIHEARCQNKQSWAPVFFRSINECKKLKSLTITYSKIFFTNQKWIVDFLCQNGSSLEELNLAMSLTTISSQLFRAVSSDFCPNLRVLDISTCDFVNNHSFDAIQVKEKIPGLEVLRVGNVSFKRVHEPPAIKGLTKLRELSMPIGMRDTDRDDPAFITLTFSSDCITTLDLRGSIISPYTLREMPSDKVKELHIDDLYPIDRPHYNEFIKKWSHSLRVLSLVKINSQDTIKSCLDALISNRTVIESIDLSSSDVNANDLKEFLKSAQSLKTIDLSSCRSLPRGCKGQYWKNPPENKGATRSFKALMKRLNPDADDNDEAPPTKRHATTRNRRVTRL